MSRAMSDKIEYLQMLQQVIKRKAGNSFIVKGWSVTLVAASFALAAKDTDAGYVLLAYFPSVMFWLLDGYFLWQEQLYRKLYEAARTSEAAPSFSMATAGLPEAGWSGWARASWSPTAVLFHGAIFLAILVTWLIRR